MKTLKCVLIGIMILVALQSVMALAISPGHSNINYTGENSYSGSIKMINNEPFLITVSLQKSGELSKYLTFNDGTVVMAAGEQRELSYVLDLPEHLSCSTCKTDIFLTEEGTDSSSRVNAEVSLDFSIIVNNAKTLITPALNKTSFSSESTNLYINTTFLPREVKIDDFNVTEKNNQVNFLVSLRNSGKVNIDDAIAKVDIYSSNKSIGNVSSRFNISQGELKDISLNWTKTAPSYDAVLTIIYDASKTPQVIVLYSKDSLSPALLATVILAILVLLGFAGYLLVKVIKIKRIKLKR